MGTRLSLCKIKGGIRRVCHPAGIRNRETQQTTQQTIRQILMITSPAGRKFIEMWEESGKPLLAARWDSLGHVWEIGYGHTSAAGPPKVMPDTTITADEADQILASDLASVTIDVNHNVTAELNQNQFDSLISFDFNTGGLDRSSLLHAINNQMPVQEWMFTVWSHAGGQFVQGLYNRRVAEWQMFNSPVVTA